MRSLLTSANVARLAGVGPTAVKRWADSGTIPCIRTAGGHRRFRREDVDRFLARSASGAASAEWADWLDVLLHDGDTYAVQSLLFGERSRRGSWHEVARGLGTLLTEIGQRWSAGSLSIMDEHVASAALQRGLTAILEAMPVAPEAPRCLLAAPEHDEHTLGLSLVELCLREAGWRTEWAGARTPVAMVVERVERGDLTMVAMSASCVVTDEAALRRAVDEIGAACRSAGVTLALGGKGAWPESHPDATRFTDLGDFYRFALAERARPVAG
jgi:MerR family transcriptional regulator, light-induced transcriptional regulator